MRKLLQLRPLPLIINGIVSPPPLQHSQGFLCCGLLLSCNQAALLGQGQYLLLSAQVFRVGEGACDSLWGKIQCWAWRLLGVEIGTAR